MVSSRYNASLLHWTLTFAELPRHVEEKLMTLRMRVIVGVRQERRAVVGEAQVVRPSANVGVSVGCTCLAFANFMVRAVRVRMRTNSVYAQTPI